MNKDKILETYKKGAIGMLTLIDLAKFHGYTIIISPDGEVLLENE